MLNWTRNDWSILNEGNLQKYKIKNLYDNNLGWSELHASLGVNAYTTRRNTHSVYTAFAATQLDPTLRKVWYQLDNLNANTEGGMKHVRQKHNDAYHKKASKINKQREELPTSWGSDIQGIIVDNPRKLRGDRIDLLFNKGQTRLIAGKPLELNILTNNSDIFGVIINNYQYSKKYLDWVIGAAELLF